MEEATRDKQSSTNESKTNKQKPQGWIRIHSDEKMKPSSTDEQSNMEKESRDRKTRKELEKS
jgi:hypothetical protein